jgi:hypothetical protein
MRSQMSHEILGSLQAAAEYTESAELVHRITLEADVPSVEQPECQHHITLVPLVSK